MDSTLSPVPNFTPRSAKVVFERQGRGPYTLAIKGGQDAARLVRSIAQSLAGELREHFLVVLLDTRNRTLGVYVASIGTVDQAPVHPREVFVAAIAAAASGILVAHNHPTGDPTPSKADREVTARLGAVGELVGIQLIDSLVIGEGRFFSMREEATFPY